MAHLFFIDESGTDHHESPYEVVAGISITDSRTWSLIKSIKSLEMELFGINFSEVKHELKAVKLLTTKVFRKAKQNIELSSEELTLHAKNCLLDGANPTRKGITALARAKLLYVEKLLDLCIEHRCKIFAIIISDFKNLYSDTSADAEDFLRKDFVFLFERFYYYLDQFNNDPTGIIIFDEMEKTTSFHLIRRMENYFKKTSKGRERAALILPEPLFVHSDLTTGVRIADIVAYLINWGMRFGSLKKPARAELLPYVEKVRAMKTSKSHFDGEFERLVHSISAI
jgi:hypothetical protein